MNSICFAVFFGIFTFFCQSSQRFCATSLLSHNSSAQTCMYMCVCMYVYMYICMLYVCMYACMYACIHFVSRDMSFALMLKHHWSCCVNLYHLCKQILLSSCTSSYMYSACVKQSTVHYKTVKEWTNRTSYSSKYWEHLEYQL